MNVSEISPQETVESVETTEHNLDELTSQSWNLELLISGAALFATLTLPDLLDNALVYYQYNLMSDTDYVHELVPTLVIGLIKGVSYLLFAAFLIHFIMRAFWVGLVGLLAVYPTGIDYENIFYLSQYARKRFAQELGALPNYIIRLDRRCNVIFALAFSIVLLLLCVGIIYGLFILAETALQLILPAGLYNTVREVVTWVFIIGFGSVAFAINILNLPRFRENPRLAPVSFQLSQMFSLFFLGLYRPLLYIMYTFFSQIPKQTLIRRLSWIAVVFALAVFVFTYVQTLQAFGATDAFDRRTFLTLRDPSHVADANSYDNLRTPGQLISEASIQADIIREPYVRLFVSYPKSLDAELEKRFQEPKWPDNLPRKERRERRAAWYLRSFETYFSIYLNDSLYRSPNFLFTQRTDNGQRGLTAVLLTDNLKPGRNLLRITVPDSSHTTKPYCQVPFWYVPEN